tara:strand:- start:29 stop:1150 length:1122 start_codon:yes stop_codon:yes gene_type:complete
MSKFFTYILFLICFSNVISSNESDLKTERKLQFVDESYELLMVNIHSELLKKQNECSSIDQCDTERLNKLSELFSYDRVLKQFVPIYKRQPEYPQGALQRNKEGHTIVSFDINEDGTTSNHKIIEGKCTNRVADLVDCSLFDKATLKAARFLKYKPIKRGGKGVTITDVPHKFSFALEGGSYQELYLNKSRGAGGQFGDYEIEQELYVDLKNSTITKAKKLISNENWIELKEHAEKINGIHGMKYYWLGTAAYHLGNNNEALLNFNETYKTNIDDKVKGSAARFSLRTIYKDNIFSNNKFLCEDFYNIYKTEIHHYFCGLNYLQIGDSISGFFHLAEAYRLSTDTKMMERYINMIESQRNWIKEDLIKLQSSS